MADDVFMSLLPRNPLYAERNVRGIPLRVVRSDGVKYEPNIKFSEVNLNDHVTIFNNNSGMADKFTVSVILNINDTVFIQSDDEKSGWELWKKWQEKWGTWRTVNIGEEWGKHVPLIEVLDFFIRNGEPFYVHTRAIGIPSDVLWLCTVQKSRKQTHDITVLTDTNGNTQESGYVTWDLTFTKYSEVTLYKFNNQNKGVTAALKAYDKKKADAKKKKTTAKSKTTDVQKLKKCDYKKMKYSKTKKTSDCVKTLQEILDKKGCFGKTKVNQIDGWYGENTKKAVKKYQTDNKKKWGLNPTGNLDKTTFNCLCGDPPKQKTKK